MTIPEILAHPILSESWVLHPISKTSSPSGLQIPNDMKTFYTLCGGGDFLMQNMTNRWRVHGPQGLFGIEQFFWGDDKVLINRLVSENQIRPVCLNWYVFAHCLADGGLVVVIDLNPEFFGRIYFSTAELHSWNTDDYVIADSFTEWLERLVTTPGDRPYWEAPDFPRISAYE